MKTDFGVTCFGLAAPVPDPMPWGAHYDIVMDDGYVIETDRLIRALGLNFHMGSVLKYIVRSAPSQGKPGESRERDEKKALNMLHRELTGDWSQFGKPRK